MRSRREKESFTAALTQIDKKDSLESRLAVAVADETMAMGTGARASSWPVVVRGRRADERGVGPAGGQKKICVHTKTKA